MGGLSCRLVTDRLLPQQFEMVDVSLLKRHPRNPNQGDYGAIAESIEANGFFGALVVQRSTGRVLVGNHRLQVAQDQGIAKLPVLYVDVDDERALRILLADNRTARLGHDALDLLGDLLVELAMSEDGLTGTGYNGDDLDDVLRELDAIAAREDEDVHRKAAVYEVVVVATSADEHRQLLANLVELEHLTATVTIACHSQSDMEYVRDHLVVAGLRPSGRTRE